jgi:heme exporter protein D
MQPAMTWLSNWLQMGGYAGYVWPAYGVAAVVLGGMTILSLSRYRASRRLLERLQRDRRGSPE